MFGLKKGDEDLYLKNSENKKLIGKSGGRRRERLEASVLKPSEDETPREETSMRSNRPLITSDEENQKENRKNRRRSNIRAKESGVVNSAFESDTQPEKSENKPKKKKKTVKSRKITK